MPFGNNGFCRELEIERSEDFNNKGQKALLFYSGKPCCIRKTIHRKQLDRKDKNIKIPLRRTDVLRNPR
jgi:hypothetical protein